MVAVALMAVLLGITAGSAYVGAAVVARHRAQAAADLSALAAASRVSHGAAAACAQSATVASAMRAHLTRCDVEGLDVVVTLDVHLTLGRFGVGPARAVARAGPAQTTG